MSNCSLIKSEAARLLEVLQSARLLEVLQSVKCPVVSQPKFNPPVTPKSLAGAFAIE